MVGAGFEAGVKKTYPSVMSPAILNARKLDETNKERRVLLGAGIIPIRCVLIIKQECDENTNCIHGQSEGHKK